MAGRTEVKCKTSGIRREVLPPSGTEERPEAQKSHGGAPEGERADRKARAARKCGLGWIRRLAALRSPRFAGGARKAALATAGDAKLRRVAARRGETVAWRMSMPAPRKAQGPVRDADQVVGVLWYLLPIRAPAAIENGSAPVRAVAQMQERRALRPADVVRKLAGVRNKRSRRDVGSLVRRTYFPSATKTEVNLGRVHVEAVRIDLSGLGAGERNVAVRDLAENLFDTALGRPVLLLLETTTHPLIATSSMRRPRTSSPPAARRVIFEWKRPKPVAPAQKGTAEKPSSETGNGGHKAE